MLQRFFPTGRASARGRVKHARSATGLTRSRPAQLVLRFVTAAAYAGVTAVLLLLAVALVPKLFGYHTYVVRGSSMEPSLSNGSVAVTHPTSPRALQTGDVIAYRSSDTSAPVLHRIVAVSEGADGELLFTTQGDANAKPDATPIALGGAGDELVYSVPYAGYILDFAAGTLGGMLFVAVPIGLLMGLAIRDRLAPSPRPGRPHPIVQGACSNRQGRRRAP